MLVISLLHAIYLPVLKSDGIEVRKLLLERIPLCEVVDLVVRVDNEDRNESSSSKVAIKFSLFLLVGHDGFE